MEEWKKYRLGDVISIASGFAYKGDLIGKGDSYLLSMGCVSFNENFLDKGARPYDGDCPERFYAKPGDIVLATRQQSDNLPILGMPAVIPSKFKENKMIVGANLYRVVIKDKAFDNRFLFWLLKTPAYVEHIRSCQSGTTVRMITKSNIEDFVFYAPEKSIRDRISDFLWTIDDKIEVNKRINDNFAFSFLLLTCFVLWLLKLINDNLQHQADALFKSFFVDFELFREREFIETELGLIPKNWKILSFGDFIVALTEKAPVDSLPEYSVTNNGIIPRDTKFNKKLSKSSSMNKVLRKNNLVFGMSREILNWGIMEDEIGGVSSAYNIYKIDEDLVDPTYLRLYMKAKIAEFNSLIGTAAREGQSLDKGQLMQKKIYVPTKDVLQDFFAHYVPIMESIHNAEQESSRLAQLRDALLPKLMSGELKIS